jgi:hypothetical protein
LEIGRDLILFNFPAEVITALTHPRKHLLISSTIIFYYKVAIDPKQVDLDLP